MEAWNYNTNRNNMQENPLLCDRLSLQVVKKAKKLKYFEVMLSIFEFSRVWENVKSWLVYTNKLFWVAQPYFLANIIKKVSASFFFLLLRLLTVIISRN